MLTWLLVPACIFAAEMTVVTISTLRIIFLGQGKKGVAALLGMVEICIWLFAIGKVMQNLNDPACFVAFAAGFTCGNYVGVLIEQKLALGRQLVRIITPRDPTELVAALKAAHYGVTCVQGQGATGPVQILMTLIERRQLASVVAIVTAFDPKAFYSVDSVQAANAGIFPATPSRFPAMFRWAPSVKPTQPV